MESETKPALLRVELNDATLHQLKVRAGARGERLEGYLDKIFHYQFHEKRLRWPDSAGLLAGGRIYLRVEVPWRTRVRLEDWSQKQQRSVANFAGVVIESFLTGFERDPRDLAMIHFASGLAGRGAPPSESELVQAIELCESLDGRLPGLQVEKWFFSRLKPFVGRVKQGERIVDLTPEFVSDLMARGVRPGKSD